MLAVDLYLVAAGYDFCTELRYYLTVDRHPAIDNPGFSLTSTRNASR